MVFVKKNFIIVYLRAARKFFHLQGVGKKLSRTSFYYATPFFYTKVLLKSCVFFGSHVLFIGRTTIKYTKVLNFTIKIIVFTYKMFYLVSTDVGQICCCKGNPREIWRNSVV